MVNNKVYIGWGKIDALGKRDCCYTKLDEAHKLIKFIEKIIPKDSIIWCPFDDDNSNIIIALKDFGYKKIINTHINKNQDFFETYIKCDYIISNPPFQKRSQIFNRLYSFNKPFIMLQPIQAFNNNTYINHLVKNNKYIGFLCPENRMGFITNGVIKDKTTAFYSFWQCYKIPGVNGFIRLE